MKNLLITCAALGLPAAAIAGAAAYDQQEHHHTYSVDWTFAGDLAVVEHDSGALGFRHKEKIVGYFLAGRPRVVGFGCEGAHAPMIAVEAAALPRCARVEPITY